MTARTILTASNSLLRKKSKKVSRFGGAFVGLVSDLFDTLHAAGGLGLAAPQIGVLQRVFVIELPAEYDEEGKLVSPSESYVLVNPEIIRRDDEEVMEEGCLSVPGYRGKVKRSTSVTIKGLDGRGRPVRYRAEGLLAQAFQHESDHLDGVLYLDLLQSPDDLWPLKPEETPETAMVAQTLGS